MSVITRAKISLDLKFTDKECLLEALKRSGLSFKERAGTINAKKKMVSFSLIKDSSGAYSAVFTIERWDGIETRDSRAIRQEIMKEVQILHELYERVVDEKIEKFRKEQLNLACEREEKRLLSEEEAERKRAELALRKRQLERMQRKRQKQKEEQIQKRISEIKEKAKKRGFIVKEQETTNGKRLVLVRAR